ncbi:hypothetical protein Prum_084280 [Phytohabitans rumicis]|uniref:LVIVD repeat-containing protein n=1 Tax=Phytohabitans rumicis TaxID=1076125 RepID=A0A6V8LKV3_9ACTN|nr:hypothetical protein Prum_084280 [Phytohabitans rumicis]
MAVASVALLLTGAVAATPSSAQAPTAAEIPGVDEIVSSDNIRQLVNVPQPGPLAGAITSDIAFQGKYAYQGNYNGFAIYDLSRPSAPSVVATVFCPGGQNDVSVYNDLLFLSTDSSRSDDSCNSTGQSATIKESWEGIRIFDISDKTNPRYVKSVETNCGSHTHTIVPTKNGRTVYVYVSSYFPSATFPDCLPPHDLISIVKVPVKSPTDAAVVATPNLFPGDTGNGPGTTSSNTTGCHDITAYPSKDIAAGACMGDGILLDISKPEAPRVINRVRDLENFSFWHSATFNNSGTKVIFTDELGGGVGAECTAAIGPTKGADAIYDIKGWGDRRRLEFKSYFKIPRVNADTENCVAHNGSLIPVPGRDIMVQAWYQGGISVWDFTNSSRPKEIAWWERGPLSATTLTLGGSWSAYYYNGYIYSSDIVKGLDVLQVRDWRLFGAEFNRFHRLNAQSQTRY